VDFFGPRAIPALAALLLSLAPQGAQAACSALNGVFSNESVEKPDGTARTLTEFAPARDRSKLFRTEASAPSPGGFASSAPRARPKVTRLATTARLRYDAGKLTLAFLDAGGKVLSESAINPTPSPWKCVGGRLERRYETLGGLGNSIRTERTEQVLLAAAGGDLQLVETTAIVETPGEPPRRGEVHFKRVAKPEPTAGK
jgi:hypothetical protein